MTNEASKITAIVITAVTRSPEILAATIASVHWADEVLVIDKSKDHVMVIPHKTLVTDNLVIVALPWSPTVEATRAEAVKLASHPWIIMLDDDEILSPDCETVFPNFAKFIVAQVFAIPIKHYIMGRHDPRAVYWPEWRPCFFYKGAVEYASTVHAGIQALGSVQVADADGPCFINHLSHENISAWIEKTNRYTDQKDRSGQKATIPLSNWAQQILSQKLLETTRIRPGDEYLEANAILHALYEIIDGLKRWEEASLPDGTEEFRKIATQVLERSRK